MDNGRQQHPWTPKTLTSFDTIFLPCQLTRIFLYRCWFLKPTQLAGKGQFFAQDFRVVIRDGIWAIFTPDFYGNVVVLVKIDACVLHVAEQILFAAFISSNAPVKPTVVLVAPATTTSTPATTVATTTVVPSSTAPTTVIVPSSSSSSTSAIVALKTRPTRILLSTSSSTGSLLPTSLGRLVVAAAVVVVAAAVVVTAAAVIAIGGLTPTPVLSFLPSGTHAPRPCPFRGR